MHEDYRHGLLMFHLHAHVGEPVHILDQHLDAALCDLRDADKGCVPLLPVRILQQRGQQARCQRGHSVPAERQRYSVQALLAKLVQLPLPFALVLVCVRPVPVGLILQTIPSNHMGRSNDSTHCLGQQFAIEGACNQQLQGHFEHAPTCNAAGR